MQIKPGVRLTNLTPQMCAGWMIVASVYWAHGAECTVTSGDDSVHGDPTLHGKGNALDFRTKDYPGDKHALEAELRHRLGVDYYVEFEHEGKEQEHMHVEYDPK